MYHDPKTSSFKGGVSRPPNKRDTRGDDERWTTVRDGVLSIYRGPDPIPPRAFVKMRYCNSGGLSTSGISTYVTGTEGGVLQLNSIYEPQVGGHQPYGRDTWATMYYKYKVHKVELQFELANSSGFNQIFTALFNNPSSTQTVAGNIVDVIKEKPFTLSKVLATAMTGSINKVIDIATLCCINKLEFESNTKDYASLIGANPTNLVKCRFAVTADSTSASPMMVSITMIQHVEFFERVSLAQS